MKFEKLQSVVYFTEIPTVVLASGSSNTESNISVSAKVLLSELASSFEIE